jgi:hypothetical protein
MPSKLIRVPEQLDQQIKALARKFKVSEASLYRRAAAQWVQDNQSAPSILDADWKPVPCSGRPSMDPDVDLYGKPPPIRNDRKRRRK